MIRLYIIIEGRKYYYNKDAGVFRSDASLATIFTDINLLCASIKDNNAIYDFYTKLYFEYVSYTIHFRDTKYKLSDTWYNLEEVNKVCERLNMESNLFYIKENITVPQENILL